MSDPTATSLDSQENAAGRRAAIGWFVLVLVAMGWVTIRASLDSDVLTGGGRVWDDPWGRATIFDAYFAFAAAYLLILGREPRWPVRIAWLVAYLTLGNFAIAAWFLRELVRLPEGAPWSEVLRPRRDRR